MGELLESSCWMRRLAVLLLMSALLPGMARATAAAFDAALKRIGTVGGTAVGEDRLDELARLLPPGDVRRSVQLSAFTCHRDTGDVPVVLKKVETDLVIARRLGERAAELSLTYCRAGLLDRAEQLEPAAVLAAYERGIVLARELRDWRQLADGLVQRGSVYSMQGDQVRAVTDFLHAQELYEAIHLPRAADANLLYIGTAYRRLQEDERALEYLHKSREQGARAGDLGLEVAALIQIGFLHDDRGRAKQATAAFEQALVLATRDNNRSDMGGARLGLAKVQIHAGRYNDALDTLARTVADFASIQDVSSDEMIAMLRGEALAGLGRHDEALVEYNRAWQAMHLQGNERYLSLLYPSRAASYEALGRTADAVRDLKAQVALQQRLGAKAQTQQTELLRYRFDARRRDLDNQRLRAQRTRRQQQVAALQGARLWRERAMAMSGLLLCVLLLLSIGQLRRLRGLNQLALTDALTGVANLRHVRHFGEDALRLARHRGTPLSVVAFDLDHFKPINDAHGHAVGDRVLARVAECCGTALRQNDLLGRTGGEEFLVVLPGSDGHASERIAERIRSSVEGLDLSDLHTGLRVTLSLGVAQLAPTDRNLHAVIERADRAIYRAKAAGRNRVVAALEPAANRV